MINVNNESKIEKILDKVQLRARARTIRHSDVLDAVSRIEDRLTALKIPKTKWRGAEFFCSPHAQNFPNAYKGIPEATAFRLRRGSSAWFVIEISRMYCNFASSITFKNEGDFKNFFKF